MAIEHLKRLRGMLEQVGSTEPSPSLESFERRTSKPEGPVLDLRRTDARRMEAEFALESLDVLRRGEEVDADQRFALEAIVMPYYRPVVDVLENQMKRDQLTKKWEHLAADRLRPHIERCFLSVGRINVPGLPSLPYAGTGFIVGPDLLMTNRHVAQTFAQGVGTHCLEFQSGQTACVDFYHENGRTQSERLDVERVVMIHPYWDMALLKVSGLHENRLPLALGIADPADMADREVLVIGYPGYDPWGDAEFQRIQDRIFRSTYYVKRMQPGLLRTRCSVESYRREVQAITHDSSTLGGNSGSVIVVLPKRGEDPPEKGLQVIGLHFAGEYLVANYAVPTSDLAQDSRIIDAEVKFAGRAEPRGDFYGPIWRDVDVEAAPRASEPEPQTPAVRPAPLVSDSCKQSSRAITTSWIIPIEVSVTVGQAAAHAAPAVVAKVQRAVTEGAFTRRPPTPTSELPYRFSAASLEEPRFDWNAALSLALASRLAYETPTRVETTAGDRWHLESCRFIEADDTQCFVASTAAVTVLAFRGTESVGDWLADLNIASRSRPYGVIHLGFLGAFRAVESQLLSALAALSNRPLLLTGHSLGGALATVAAAEWHDRFKMRVMTFGQPAVGKGTFEQFMQRYAGSFFRIVNDDDVVARVPPTYRHVGQLIHFDAVGNVPTALESAGQGPGERMLTEAEFDGMRAALLRQRAERRVVGLESLEAPVVEGLLPSLSDHRLDAYISKTAAHIKTADATL